MENNINLQDESIRWKWRHAITEIIEPWFKTRAVKDFADDFDNCDAFDIHPVGKAQL